MWGQPRRRRSTPTVWQRHPGAVPCRPPAPGRPHRLLLRTAAASNESVALFPPVRPPSLAGVWARIGQRSKGPLRRPLIPLADRRFLLGRDVDEVAQRTQRGERLTFELPHALAREIELVPDRLERPRLSLEAEPQLEDPPLALRKRIERAPHPLPAKGFLGF